LEAVARRGVQARERELAACHQIIEAHVAALMEKLSGANEQLYPTNRNKPLLRHKIGTASNLLLPAA
jgi:glutamyl-tRNA reductase